MADFDAEYHLRRHAEDELLAASEDEDAQSAPARAHALVALDLLRRARAHAVLRTYARARALRTGSPPAGWYEFDDDEQAQTSSYSRVCSLARDVTTSDGTVHLRYAAVGPTRIRIAVTIDFGTLPANQHPLRRPRHLTLDVADDQGNTGTLHFSGGGGSRTWSGQFEGENGLSPRTAWLEIAGERVELHDADPGATVTITSTADEAGPELAARAVGYLEHCLERETGRHHAPSVLPAVLDTVVASGALAADAPEVATARAVQAAIANDPPADLQVLPERWRSVLVAPRRRRRAATGEIVLGEVLPPIDGLLLTLLVLAARREQFDLELEGHGRASDQLVLHGHGSPLSFTATDDHGRFYVGHPEEWHSGSDGFGGTVAFSPALDAAATRLDLVFSTTRARARVTVPLRWAATS